MLPVVFESVLMLVSMLALFVFLVVCSASLFDFSSYHFLSNPASSRECSSQSSTTWIGRKVRQTVKKENAHTRAEREEEESKRKLTN